MKTLLIALALLATGCATHWSKPGATPDAFNRDSYDCAERARQNYVSFNRAPLQFGPGADAMGVNKELYRSCLQARGYQRTADGTWVGVRD